MNTYDFETLRAAISIIKRDPKQAIEYLTRSSVPKEVILSLAMEALLEVTKQKKEVAEMALAVANFLKDEQVKS